jgi:ubiquinone/menaquinone biosynthesis C-methylase UbiE
LASSYDRWAGSDAYERYIGRWARPVADEFVVWLDEPPGQRWLDVGCGTGDAHRDAIREQLRRSVSAAPDGSIHLEARAWAVRARGPG